RTATRQLVEPVCPVAGRLAAPTPLADVAFSNVVDTTPTTAATTTTTGPTTTSAGSTTTAASTTTTGPTTTAGPTTTPGSGGLPTFFPPDPCPTLPVTGPNPDPEGGLLVGGLIAVVGIGLLVLATRRWSPE